ncbi:MFS transporter [Steroidobacter sp. S1-65]|uniref:MFS transporter n=1 Tax=Steroidobacter gossypii TaxID=2805490 RepID=A0ABS1X0D5_9GAMM|nr:MFS transporter [Steroidobacter gossypii]MBM0106704.1 MFS transporter [Steroidobacter gossypii]
MTELAGHSIETDCASSHSRRQCSELTNLLLLTLAITCAISVANIYYAQPLLASMAATFSISAASIGLVITLTQVGYALGLLLVVPLGDVVDRRKLVLIQTMLSAMALVAVGKADDVGVLFGAMIAVGLLAVVVQVLVAYTATLAAPAQRGRAVGIVTSGVVIGILSARLISGVIADLGGWRSVYLSSAALMLFMTVPLARLLPANAATPTSESYASILRSIPTLFLRDRFLRARAVLAIFTFASFSTLWTALALPLSAAPLSLSHTQIGLFGLAGLIGALAASGAGSLADRGLGQRTTGISLALLTLSWWPIALLPSSLLALASGVILLDLAVQAIHVTNQTAMFAAYPAARSRLVGGYMVFYSIGSGLGAISSTAIYSALGWTGVAALGATFSAAGLLFWWFTARTSPS